MSEKMFGNTKITYENIKLPESLHGSVLEICDLAESVLNSTHHSTYNSFATQKNFWLNHIMIDLREMIKDKDELKETQRTISSRISEVGRATEESFNKSKRILRDRISAIRSENSNKDPNIPEKIEETQRELALMIQQLRDDAAQAVNTYTSEIEELGKTLCREYDIEEPV